MEGRGGSDESSTPGLEIATEAMNDMRVEATTADEAGGGVEITNFSELVDDVTLHFQIIRLQKQIFAWIGFNSAELGHLFVAAPTRPGNTVSVTSLLGRKSVTTGSGIAHRIVLKTGLNIVLACRIPKNSPLIEAAAERKLVQKLLDLGYATLKSRRPS